MNTLQIFITIQLTIQTDYKTLLQGIYNKTSGATWLVQPNWFQPDIEICNFTGVKCNENIIEELDFTDFGIRGPIPDEIGNFTHIKSILLSKNSINQFPEQVCTYTKSLMYLHLSSSGLQGQIPQCLCDMQGLKYLFLDNNDLSGQIPQCISSLPALQIFVANCNQLTGSMGGNITGQKLQSYQVGCNQIDNCDQINQIYNQNGVKTLCQNDACNFCEANCPSHINLPICGKYILVPKITDNNEEVQQ